MNTIDPVIPWNITPGGFILCLYVCLISVFATKYANRHWNTVVELGVFLHL
jgi:hypothetical protein